MKKHLARLVVLSLIATLISIPGWNTKEAFADNTSYITIKSKKTSKFVTVGSNGTLTASGINASTNAEWFEYVTVTSTSFKLRSKLNGKFIKLNSSNQLVATEDSAQNAKTFVASTNDDKSSSLKASIGNNKDRFIAAADASTVLTAGSTSVGDTEKFYYAFSVNRILEITSDGTSDLQSFLGSKAEFSVETVSMKRFVALRGELDGKYDTIYIGKGTYNPEKVPVLTSDAERDSAHNTTAKMNDITALKAKEIIDQFINKGQLVLLYHDPSSKNGLYYQPKENNQYGILYSQFSKYISGTRPSNVKLLSSTKLSSLADDWDSYTSSLKKRPKLVINSQPVSYQANSSYTYTAGDTLSFDFGISNRTTSMSNVTASLYIGLDSAKKFEANQLVATKTVSGTNDILSYRLPNGYTGLYYWKLELVDETTKLKSSETGVVNYLDQLTQVRVLQIMPTGSSSSSLNTTTNMNSNFLDQSGKYKISITTTTADAFKALSQTAKDSLNSTYDMLIFGFVDEYNKKADIDQATADAVKKFVATGQSVMFTHDTVYSNNGAKNVWINNFQALSGQIEPWTNMGLSARKKSTTVAKVNEGLLTEYPYDLDYTTPVINTTHNQYFTLNLEDEDVVPWYNITGGTRDANDSWNHYYTYSKGNVTYSGTGHTNTNFPEWEQKLFVNTMYRAFMGSNHKPVITVSNPLDFSSSENNYLPSDQNISLNFIPDDYDFSDRKLNVDVKLIVNNQVVPGSGYSYSSTDAASGAPIIQTLTNPLAGSEGSFIIKITVTDSKGAEAIKLIPVTVKKIVSNLSVNRTISGLDSSNRIKKDATAKIMYTITPVDIKKSGNSTATKLTLSNVVFSERIPANLKLSGATSNISLSGNETNGYTLSNTYTINYTLNSAGTYYVASPITFSVDATPTKVQSYALNNATLNFKDLDNVQKSLRFPDRSFSSYSILESLSFTIPNKEMIKGEQDRYIASYTPTEVFPAPVLTWSSSDSSIVSVDNNGNITAVKAGRATITALHADSGLRATGTVDVSDLTLSVSPATVAVGSKATLSANFTTLPNETINASSVTWSIPVADSAKASITNVNGIQSATLNALQSGTITVTLNFSTNKKANYTAQTTISITDPSPKINVPDRISKGDKFSVSISDLPLASSLVQNSLIKVEWGVTSSTGSTIAGLVNTLTEQLGSANPSNQLLAKEAGNANLTAKVTLLGATLATISQPITILDRVPKIEGAELISVDDKQELGISWTGMTPSFSNPRTWSLGSGSSDYAQLNTTTGMLTPTKPGRITVQSIIPSDAGFNFNPTKVIEAIRLKLVDAVEMPLGKTFDLKKPGILTVDASTNDLINSIKDQLVWKSTDTSKVSVGSTTGVLSAKAATGDEGVVVEAYFPALDITLKVKIKIKINTDKY